MNSQDLEKDYKESPPQANKPFGEAQGIYGVGYRSEEPTPYQPCIRELVEKKLSHSQQEANKANKLYELFSLLKQHPEVERILTLAKELNII